MTRFKSGEHDTMAEEGRADPSQRLGRWAILAGDVYEDENKILVRLEVPGLNKDDLHIEVRDDVLTVGGEKRFQREFTEGHYPLLQCAYGSLPAGYGSAFAQDGQARRATS